MMDNIVVSCYVLPMLFCFLSSAIFSWILPSKEIHKDADWKLLGIISLFPFVNWVLSLIVIFIWTVLIVGFVINLLFKRD